MKENKGEKTYLMIAIFIALLTALTLFVFAGMPMRNTTELVPTKVPDETKEIVKNDGTVSIPGYEALSMTAGEIRQKLVFYNPVENNCYFRISIVMPDGEVLWKSELIPPGMQTEYIDLKRPLNKGTYDGCSLVYSVYADKEETKTFNGAKELLTIFAR